MATAKDTAGFLVWLASHDKDKPGLSHLSLQKILYYIQGWSLAWRDQAMFDEPMEAWKHGPAVRTVWQQYNDCGDRLIPPGRGEWPSLAQDDKKIIRNIWNRYKGYTPSELRNMTHNEPPWRDARGDIDEDEWSANTITLDAMREYFSHEANENAIPGLEPEMFRRAEADIAEGRYVSLNKLLNGPTDGV